jgi:hypothetical protein
LVSATEGEKFGKLIKKDSTSENQASTMKLLEVPLNNSAIPQKYKKPETSGESIVIEPKGKRHFVFDLMADPSHTASPSPPSTDTEPKKPSPQQADRRTEVTPPRPPAPVPKTPSPRQTNTEPRITPSQPSHTEAREGPPQPVVSPSPSTSPPPDPSRYKNIFGAAERGTVSDVRYYVQRGASVNGLRMEDRGRSPLHFAAMSNADVAVVKYLVARGASVNRRDGYEETPLHLAAKLNPNPDVLRYLVSVADIELRPENIDGKTPLDIAKGEEKKRILTEAIRKH